MQKGPLVCIIVLWIVKYWIYQQVGVALSTVSWLACEGDSAPRAAPATDEAVVPPWRLTLPASSLSLQHSLALLLSWPHWHLKFHLYLQPANTKHSFKFNITQHFQFTLVENTIAHERCGCPQPAAAARPTTSTTIIVCATPKTVRNKRAITPNIAESSCISQKNGNLHK